MKFKKLLVWVGIVLIWFLLTIEQLQGEYTSQIIPNPVFVFEALINLIKGTAYGTNLPLINHAGISFGRMLKAIFYAIITAIPLGLLCGYFKKVETIVSAIIDFVRPLPPLAYYTLITYIVVVNFEAPKVVLLYIAAFCPLYVSCVMAVRQVKQDHILSAKTLGATELQVFKHVVFPSSLPNVFTGLRTAVSVAYTTLATAEIFAASDDIGGLGFLIARSYDLFRMDQVFVGIIIIGISAILFDTLLKYLENKVVFWKGMA